MKSHKRLAEIEFDQWLGGRVRDVRKQYGWSQEQLAKKLRMQQHTWSRYESGQFSLTANQLAQLSAIFSLTLDSWFVGDETWQKVVPQL